MKVTALSRGLLLIGVAVIVAVTLSVSLAVGSTPQTYPPNYAPDSTTIERLTRDQSYRVDSPLAPSITLTQTAAVLAGQLLIVDFDFRVDLPLVTR